MLWVGKQKTVKGHSLVHKQVEVLMLWVFMVLMDRLGWWDMLFNNDIIRNDQDCLMNGFVCGIFSEHNFIPL